MRRAARDKRYPITGPVWITLRFQTHLWWRTYRADGRGNKKGAV
jgi:hypothetical protein